MAEVQHVPGTILVTGGAGFIGCNLVRHLLATDPAVRVVNVDALTYAGSLANLTGVENAYPGRHRFVHADICDQAAMRRVFEEERIDTVIHLAAESHVDRSITAPETFLQTNVIGTYVLLQTAREAWHSRGMGVSPMSNEPRSPPPSDTGGTPVPRLHPGAQGRFHHVSTDEVFGSLGPKDSDRFTEATPYDPSSPYSASKAASDHLARAWHRTYGLDVTISNCSNNYGPFQFPEKLLPLMICRALAGRPLPVYGDGQNVRDWLFVEDHCAALDRIVRFGVTGRTYNVGGNNEWKNIDIVRLLCDKLQSLRPPPAGHYRDQITFVPDRPGHDRRYAIDAGRLAGELQWTPRHDFETGLTKTIQWYLANQPWVEAIRGGPKKYDGERLGLVPAQPENPNAEAGTGG